MSATDEGQALIDEAGKSTTGDDFKTYLSDKCGIESSDTTSPADSAPVDTSATVDTSASGDTIVDLGEGEDAINKFLDFYELGTSTKLTDEQRSCIVSELTDKITGADLNQAIAGQASEAVSQALGLAFIGCNVEVQT
jgi:hypothetical protein